MYEGNRKRAFVTGAGGGFGRALCVALARRGYRIAVTDINVNGATETALMVKDSGGEADTMKVDVTKSQDLESGAERFCREWGGIDLLINNAGVAVVGRAHEIKVKDWRFIVNTNLLSVVFGCRAFIPRMIDQGGGHIINVASLAGIASLPEMGPYNVTKAAVISMSETLKGELNRDNIGVTVVCPSFFKTNIMDSLRSTEEMRGVARTAIDSSELTADEIAEIALGDMDANHLYSIPHRTGKMMWRAKRTAPELLYRVLGQGSMEEFGEKLVPLINKLK
jgi:NAD(P)-dependent dehydrogenase (short-subunit alcohol dehydrogenase family)